MYQRKLRIAFSVFVILVILQTFTTLWAFKIVDVHNERSRVAQQMLTQIVQFRVDAKRLQVWLADYLLMEKSDTSHRDALFTRMKTHLQQLEALNKQTFLSSTFPSDQDFSARMQRKSLQLIDNVQALEVALQTRQIRDLSSDAERWQTLVRLIDKIEGFDVVDNVNDLIRLHTQKSMQAEDEAAAIAQFIRHILIAITLTSVLFFIGISGYLTRHFVRSLDRLVQGAERLKVKDFSALIPEQGLTEFIYLARAFNQMSKSLQGALEQQKKLQNVTEEKVIERTAQLQHVITQLSDAEQRQKHFMAEISHELRTPTTIIMSEAEWALRRIEILQPAEKARFERILEGCKTLRSRIDDLIMLSKGQHALVSVKLQPASVKQWYERLKQQAQLQATHFAVKVNDLTDPQAYLPEGLSKQTLHLFIDQEKMDLACRILIENALVYQDSERYLGLEMLLTHTELHMHVIDRGIGLTEAERSLIFTRYRRSEQAVAMRPDGLGIGLKIAKDIISAHDGDLMLLSNRPRGVIAKITLPLFDFESDSE